MDLSRFDLNLLRSLDALLRERSVTRAAEQLRITQQAMSGMLRRLREQFDDPLLVRSGRTLALTARAMALVEPVRDVMQDIERALLTRPQFDAATSERRFSVAMSDYSAFVILPRLMARLSVEAPRITLKVKQIRTSATDDLLGGDLDLCLAPAEHSLFRAERSASFQVAELLQDDFVCVVSKHSKLCGDTISGDQYFSMRHATLRLGQGMRPLVELAWHRLGAAPHVAVTASNFFSAIVAVSESELIATVQRRLARQLAAMLPIRVLECPIAVGHLHLSMIWRRSSESDPAHRFLRELVVHASGSAGFDNARL